MFCCSDGELFVLQLSHITNHRLQETVVEIKNKTGCNTLMTDSGQGGMETTRSDRL